MHAVLTIITMTIIQITVWCLSHCYWLEDRVPVDYIYSSYLTWVANRAGPSHGGGEGPWVTVPTAPTIRGLAGRAHWKSQQRKGHTLGWGIGGYVRCNLNRKTNIFLQDYVCLWIQITFNLTSGMGGGCHQVIKCGLSEPMVE